MSVREDIYNRAFRTGLHAVERYDGQVDDEYVDDIVDEIAELRADAGLWGNEDDELDKVADADDGSLRCFIAQQVRDLV